MSVTVPSDLELLDPNAIVGNVEVSEEPLHTLLRRINWLFATYTPAACNFVGVQGTTNNSVTFRVPFPASADSLNYQPVFVVLTDTTGNFTIDIDECDTFSGTYSAVSGYGSKTLSCTATDANVFWSEDSFPVAASTEFIEVTVTQSDPTAYIQLAAFMAYPAPLELSTGTSVSLATKLPTGRSSSGVWIYEDAHLTSTGAAVHTEYMNRPVRAVSALAADRVQCVGSFVQNTGYDRGFALGTGHISRTFFRNRLYLPGNVGSATVTVKLGAREGGTGGSVTVGQMGAPSDSWHTFSVPQTTATAQSATITVWGERPEIIGIAHIDSRSDILYMVLEWVPDFASNYEPTGSYKLVDEPAPPPKAEVLAACEQMTMRLADAGYAACATTFYAGYFRASDWNAGGTPFSGDNVAYAFQRVPPGVKGMRTTFVRGSDGGGGEMSDTTFGSKPGSGGAEQTGTVESPVEGGEVAPWSADAAYVEVYDGGAEYAASGSGDDPIRTAEDREAHDLLVVMERSSGLSGEWIRVDDLSAV